MPAGCCSSPRGSAACPGAQPKAGNISGVVSGRRRDQPQGGAETPRAGMGRRAACESLDALDPAHPSRPVTCPNEVVSMAYVGNVVDLWERLAAEEIAVDLGSDQTSLHNPWAGGYYPVGVELRGVEQDDGRGARPLPRVRAGVAAPPGRRHQQTHRRGGCISSTTATPSCWKPRAPGPP